MSTAGFGCLLACLFLSVLAKLQAGVFRSVLKKNPSAQPRNNFQGN